MTDSVKRTKCSKCGDPIFTAGDSFLPDPFSPAGYANLPLCDTYANGAHLLNCEGSIAARTIPKILFSLKSDLAMNGKAPAEVEAEIQRRKKAWFGN